MAKKTGRVLAVCLVSALFIMLLAGCGSTQTLDNVVTDANTLDVPYDLTKAIGFEIVMENGEVITGELYPKQAPITVRNFIKLAEEGFYDGLTFHRVVDGKLIQGGDPKGNGTGGPGYNIWGEFSSNGWNNTLKHKRGMLSMARAQDYNSGGSQFFIVLADSTSWDGEYATFGKVTTGLKTADTIGASASEGETPDNPQIISTIRIIGEPKS